MDKSKLDPKVRDRKKLFMSELHEAVPLFMFSLLVTTPMLITVLIPLAIVGQIVGTVCRLFQTKPNAAVAKDPNEIAKLVRKQASDETGRVYDLIIYGATGFTGNLAALYLAKQYGSDVRWAIAGRRQDALEKVKKQLIAISPDLVDLPIVIADSNNDSALEDMVQKTKVVITTTGPFYRYGSKLVKACALFGTHYCDITGELDWVREMIDQYDEAARVSGARLVSLCGHDCVPWDLIVFEAAQELKKKGDVLKDVTCFDEVVGLFSGGTLETALAVIQNRVIYRAFIGFDPLLKSLSGGKSESKTKVVLQMLLSWNSLYGAWVGPFVMAAANASVIRRSNALNHYSESLTYREAFIFPSFIAGYTFMVSLVAFGAALAFQPFQYLLRKFVLPAPGQGPSKESMDKGWLKITVKAIGENGNKVSGYVYFPTDAGYRDTARMLVESGLVLALQIKKVKVGGGHYTPAACQGRLLLDRLIATGCSFEMSSE